MSSLLFFFQAAAPTEFYTLSLHDALPISMVGTSTGHASSVDNIVARLERLPTSWWQTLQPDRKSTRLNSSHRTISYAVFCLKKKKQKTQYLLNDLHTSTIHTIPSTPRTDL